MSIIQISELLLKNIDEEISWLFKNKSSFHLIHLFEDTMHIWRYYNQKLEMTVYI